MAQLVHENRNENDEHPEANQDEGALVADAQPAAQQKGADPEPNLDVNRNAKETELNHGEKLRVATRISKLKFQINPRHGSPSPDII